MPAGPAGWDYEAVIATLAPAGEPNDCDRSTP